MNVLFLQNVLSNSDFWSMFAEKYTIYNYTHKCIQTDVFITIKTSFNIKKEKIDKSSYVSNALVVIVYCCSNAWLQVSCLMGKTRKFSPKK